MNLRLFRSIGCLIILGAMCTPCMAKGDWGVFVGPDGQLGFSYNDNKHDIHVDTRDQYRNYDDYRYNDPGYYDRNYTYGNRYEPSGRTYYHSDNQSYYPNYQPRNPVVRRDVTDRGYYRADGTYHSDRTVEDRRASSYSPGRNIAVTKPRTTVTHSYGPDGSWNTREKTSWIGADGRPHSTTVDRQTTQDIWGNTHTDTHVTLKKKGDENQEESKESSSGVKGVKSSSGGKR
ncbi:MAG: hypothetical protein KC931_07820 [Candidatus Omnitrophica bacterium]|nr:hypothetical protein [Candidatus Omnitrophota bacterium]